MKTWKIPHIEYIPFDEIEDIRPVLVITTEGAWESASNKLDHLNVIANAKITTSTPQHWQQVVSNFNAILTEKYPAITNTGVVIYSIGGGLAVDAAKFISKKMDIQLTCLPTALSVDAFLTWASAVRSDGCVKYIETKHPDQVIIDLDFLGSAPAILRAAGICDVLSIYTGLWDWHFAEEKGRNPEGMQMVPGVVDQAEAILKAALECAPAAGAGDCEGLKQLVTCLADEVALCNQIGHARPEEGSEHYFAYSIENHLSNTYSHGELVGPGIILMASYQGQMVSKISDALNSCQVLINHLPHDIVGQTLSGLAAYSTHHDLPFGIAHTLKA